MGIVVSTTSTGRVVVVTTAVFSTGVTPAPDLVVVVVDGSFVVVVSASTVFGSSTGFRSSTGCSICSTTCSIGSTTTGYYYGSVYSTFTSSTQNGEAGSNQAVWLRVATGSSNGLNGMIDVFSPFASSRTSAHWVQTHQQTAGFVSRGSGFLDNATSYTAFTLTPNSGTLTGGTISVYGYAK
jgi:hypothetical protein